MDDTPARPGNDGNSNAALAVQLPASGQLATPALSPISEYGETEIQISPFPGYDGDEEDNNTGLQTRRVSDVGHRSSEEEPARRRGSSNIMLKLSPIQIQALVTEPHSIPTRPLEAADDISPMRAGAGLGIAHLQNGEAEETAKKMRAAQDVDWDSNSPFSPISTTSSQVMRDLPIIAATPGALSAIRPSKARSASTPLIHRKSSSSKVSSKQRTALPPLKIGGETDLDLTRSGDSIKPSPKHDISPSPIPSILPVPPLSLPTYLQLELSSDRPSALYLHRPTSSDFPYESSKVKFERLLNLLRLPLYLENVLFFGAIACLDAWLYTFTILPLRFLKATGILLRWWGQNAIKEVLDLCSFVYEGVGRVWRRRRLSFSASGRPSFAAEGEQPRKSSSTDLSSPALKQLNSTIPSSDRQRSRRAPLRHRRTRSTPSALLPNHKADLLQGFLILLSSAILLSLDASRSYHSIRGQSAIKLYVIYNVLEVFDRLLSALGQDILECLFSREILERDEHGRSKVLLPLGMFLAALVYNVVHATALFYQVVTLNVAVNSYSNALLTLLMSNQFVEIKGTVFKKFEKEALFQLTCADVVERFQLWLMLVIIALRNIVEVGGLSISLSNAFAAAAPSSNAETLVNTTTIPQTFGFAIPRSFTLMPAWTGEVLGPFLFVLMSEMAVDWLKHGYITKFNNIRPAIFSRFLDVLAKDYYTHAFVDQNLTKRLGLPVIPLSCLFIRAGVQTYHMFLATHMPLPIPSPATSIALDDVAAASSPATTAALQHIDQVFRRALGRSSFGAGTDIGRNVSSQFSWWKWSIDDIIAFAAMATFFLALYLILLACKLVLGMILLSWSRRRLRAMKDRERTRGRRDSVSHCHQHRRASGSEQQQQQQRPSQRASTSTTRRERERGEDEFAAFTNPDAERVGGWGVTEVGEERRKWIYEDDEKGLVELREKEERGRKRFGAADSKDKLEGVERYVMAGKRIW